MFNYYLNIFCKLIILKHVINYKLFTNKLILDFYMVFFKMFYYYIYLIIKVVRYYVKVYAFKFD